jgi:hypothetical protein
MSELRTWCWTTCRSWSLDRRPTDTLRAGAYREAAAALRALKRDSLLPTAYLWRQDLPQHLHRVILHEREPLHRCGGGEITECDRVDLTKAGRPGAGQLSGGAA